MNFYEKIAHIYENPVNSKFYKSIAEKLCKLIKKSVGNRNIFSILELGAGTGYSTEILRKYFSEAEIWATDPSLKMLKIAKNKNISKTKYIVLDAENIQTFKIKFDLIFGNFCYHWFTLNIASQLKNHLTHNGIIAFSIPVNLPDGTLGNKLLLKIYKNIKKNYFLSSKHRLKLKNLLSEFAEYNLKTHIFSFSETRFSKNWAYILRSRGSWYYLFGEFAQEAENLWYKYTSHKNKIPLNWHVLLLIGLPFS
ncbi:hypothetical protein DRN73_00460 [Candidatus Pacearchaeota archaeon]|nr:MAG: hypothetical protein DRN73_00460 [Candidatus Pacearchaeota archaeon]